MKNKITLQDILICPKCSSDSLVINEVTIHCNNCNSTYPIVNGIPVLINEDPNLISVREFSEFYDKQETYKAMNLGLGNNAASRRIYLLESILKKYKPKSFLDISVGNGRMSQLALNSGAKVVFGVDISIEILENARKRLGTSFIPINADARFLPFKDNSIEFVNNLNLIEHLDDWQRCLQKTLKISRRVVCISTNTKSLSSKINFAKFGEHPAGHMHIYNHYELKNLLENYGKIQHSYVYTFIPYHIFTKMANMVFRTDKYGVGQGLKTVRAIPKYRIPIKPKSFEIKRVFAYLKESTFLFLGRRINELYNFLEEDYIWTKELQKRDYPLASFYVVEKQKKI